jgi:hypothetical protein
MAQRRQGKASKSVGNNQLMMQRSSIANASTGFRKSTFKREGNGGGGGGLNRSLN